MPPDWPNKPVDGYDRKHGIIYEHLGDYYHGHPSRWGTRGGVAFGPDLKRNGKIRYFKDLFFETQEKIRKLSRMQCPDRPGETYTVVYKWGCLHRSFSVKNADDTWTLEFD